MSAEIEQEIQRKGLNAPRVTSADVGNSIVAEYYTTGDKIAKAQTGPTGVYPSSVGCLTICVIVMDNGYTVVGTSACASLENFDEVIGRKLARQKAVDQIWGLLGFSLKEGHQRRNFTSLR